MVTWSLSLIIIAVGNWNGRIHFGLGLADIIYVFIIAGVLLLVGILYVTDLYKMPSSSVSKKNITLGLICFVFLVFIILKMTFLRGGESSWNSKIFF